MPVPFPEHGPTRARRQPPQDDWQLRAVDELLEAAPADAPVRRRFEALTSHQKSRLAEVLAFILAFLSVGEPGPRNMVVLAHQPVHRVHVGLESALRSGRPPCCKWGDSRAPAPRATPRGAPASGTGASPRADASVALSFEPFHNPRLRPARGR